MRKYLTVKLCSPISLNKDRATENTKTLDYIPGTTIRGGIASGYLNSLPGKKPDETFKEIFLDEKVRFGNLYPEGSSPIPKTAVSCKRWKGFKNEEGEHHGVYDNLPLLGMRWVITSTGKNSISELDKINKILKENRLCRICNKNGQEHPLEPFSNYYKYKLDFNKEPVRVIQKKRLLTRTGINRRTGNVEHNILFNIEVLSAWRKSEKDGKEYPTKFGGWIEFDESDSSLSGTIEPFLKENSILRIGVARSRGLGKVQVASFKDDGRDNDIEKFKIRLNSFNKFFHKMAKSLGKDIYRKYFNNHYFFTIDLYSDLIVFDKFLRYKTRLDDDEVSRMFPAHHNEISIIGGIRNTSPVIGWNAALGMPKSDEIAIDKGSVFLLSYKGDRPDESLFKRLMSLESDGWGSRKGEGFGGLKISDEFHTNKTFQFDISGGAK